MTAFAAGSFVGRPVRRVEDPALLRGEATYVDNLKLDHPMQLAFVRSPFAHAELRGIDTSAALEMPGVIGVYTADNLELPEWKGLMQVHPAIVRPPLAIGRVRFVGDMVAVVVAETKAQAVDASELVEVDYEPLPVVVDMEASLADGAPVIFEAVGDNAVSGKRSAGGDTVLDGAEVVVRGRFENQRLTVVPMEGSAVAVVPGGDEYDMTVYLTCQMPHVVQGEIAGIFECDPARIRVIAPDVGGAFGAKHLSVEAVIAIKLALQFQRPVKWMETRSENMVALPQGRAQVQFVELGLRRDGTIVGLRCRVIGDGGGYGGFGGILVSFSTSRMVQGVYHIPAIAYDSVVTVTNTTPTGAYRGAGRPEATALIERIMDMAADELGIDPVELRRRNLIGSDEFPFATVTGVTYDSGDYDAALSEALRIADYDALLAEQAQRRARGDRLQLGIGVAVYVEITGGGWLVGSEYAQVSVHDDGTATVKAGTSAHGQGHATAFSMLAADRLGIPMEKINFIQSDTAQVRQGAGTGGSRSLQLGGTTVAEASQLLVDRAKELAADLLEADPHDMVVVEDGGVGVAGIPASAISWGELSRRALERGTPLLIDHEMKQDGSTFPFGAHVSVVEVDMETGRVVPLRHIAVDDCGRILNPLLVDGQVHGGLASGISQALWEQTLYDDDGNPLTTTLAEYALPSAAELPSFEVAHTETPSPLNVLGAKGIGESATVGSTPAVQNAVVDALSHLGVRHLDMPCTPERVWQAIRDAKANTLPSPWREPPSAFARMPVAAGPTAQEEAAEEINL